MGETHKFYTMKKHTITVYVSPQVSEKSLLVGKTVLAASVQVPGATIPDVEEEEWEVN